MSPATWHATSSGRAHDRGGRARRPDRLARGRVQLLLGAQILIETFCLGIAAASLIFLSAYGGMVSLGQISHVRDRRASILGNIATTTGGTSKGLHLGWNPSLGLVLGDRRSRR